MAVLALVVAYVIYHRQHRIQAAAEAFSAAAAAYLDGEQAEKPERFLKVAADYPGTSAAGHALLRAAGACFAEGKYADAQAHFERFVRTYRDSQLVGQALFGVAACLEAQGRTTEAIDRYKNLLERRPNDPVSRRARLNLGRLYEAQKQWDLARAQYQEAARVSAYGAVGAEARNRLEALLSQHPELLAATNAAISNATSASLPISTGVVATNSP